MLSAVQRLPVVGKVLAWPDVAALLAAHGRPLVLSAVREELAAWRSTGLVGNELALAAGIGGRVHLSPSRRRAGVCSVVFNAVMIAP